VNTILQNKEGLSDVVELCWMFWGGCFVMF